MKGKIIEILGYDRAADEVICYEWHELVHNSTFSAQSRHQEIPKKFFDEKKESRSTTLPEQYATCIIQNAFTADSPVPGVLRTLETPDIIQEFARQIQCSAEQFGLSYAL